MNPWLVTWEPMGEREAKTIKNRIAAILPNRTGEEEVKKTLYLLYANYLAHSGLSDSIYVSEQIQFAKRKYPYKAVRNLFPVITCGGNPFLYARCAFNLKTSEEEDGYELLLWEENVYPALSPTKDAWEQIEALRPFKRKRMMYSARTNTVTRQDGP